MLYSTDCFVLVQIFSWFSSFWVIHNMVIHSWLAIILHQLTKRIQLQYSLSWTEFIGVRRECSSLQMVLGWESGTLNACFSTHFNYRLQSCFFSPDEKRDIRQEVWLDATIYSLEFGSGPFLIQNSNSCVQTHGSCTMFLCPIRTEKSFPCPFQEEGRI